MDSLIKALAEQGGAWIFVALEALLIAALLLDRRKLGEQDRKDRDLMVQVIESNTTFIKAMKETMTDVLEDVQTEMKVVHTSNERLSRLLEEVAKAITAISYGLKGLRDAIHYNWLGKFVPPGEDDQ